MSESIIWTRSEAGRMSATGAWRKSGHSNDTGADCVAVMVVEAVHG